MGPIFRIRTEAGEEELDLPEFEARVAKGEIAPHCLVRFPPVTGQDFVPAGEIEIFRALYQPRRLYFARAFNLSRFPRVTAFLVLVNIAVYLAMSTHGPVTTDTLVAFGAKVTPLVFDLAEMWRLFTANAVHVDVLHIAFNLLVLFNVGGALENAFRTADYVLLLVASALGTSLGSFVFSSNAIITAGASGIVYGTLGGAVVFGIKYRDILPARYRRLLGEWTIPPVLAFLYIGWIQKSGVDNGGHVGGLVAGALTALVLRPRLLAEPHTRLRALLRVAPAFALVVAVAAAGLVVRPWLPRTQLFVEDTLGLELAVPGDWRPVGDPPSDIAFHNGLTGEGKAAVTIRAHGRGVEAPLAREPEEYARHELYAQERAGRLADLTVLPPVPARVADSDGYLLEASFSDDGTPVKVRVYFVPRGEVVYEIALSYSSAFPAYEAVLERLLRTLAFVEPRALREARAAALLAPRSSDALSALGDVLLRYGEPNEAVRALDRAAVLSGEPPIRADTSGRLTSPFKR